MSTRQFYSKQTIKHKTRLSQMLGGGAEASKMAARITQQHLHTVNLNEYVCDVT